MSDNKQDLCPCGSGIEYDACCGPLHQGTARAKTAEALMRSRYAAFAKNNFEYLAQTLHPDTTNEHDTEQNRELYSQFEWKGLEILNTEQGGENDEQGYVDFIARYNVADTPHAIREKSLFHKIDDTWLYVEGKSLQVPSSTSKVGRNDPCPCGSGKKYKKCCMT